MLRSKPGSLFGLLFDRLIWEDFKAYRGRHSLIFRDQAPGVYLIEGRNKKEPRLENNGAGKSTIWDIICWVIYGRTIDDPKPGNDIQPWTGGKPRGELSFYKQNVCYVIRRTRSPNSLSMSIGNDPFVECDQATVEAKFGLSFEAFTCTIVLPQFGVQFLDMTPEPQSKLISGTLSLDTWLTAADKASKLANLINHEIAESKTALATVLGRLDELEAQENVGSKALAQWGADHAERLRAAVNARDKAQGALEKPQGEPRTGGKGGQKAPWALSSVLGDELGAQERSLSACDDVLEGLGATLARSEVTLSGLRSQYDEYRSLPSECPQCGQVVPPLHIKTKLTECKRRVDRAEAEVKRAQAALSGHRDVRMAISDQLHETRKKLREAREKEIREEELEKMRARQRELDKELLEELKAKVEKLKKETNPFTAQLADVKERRAKVKARKKELSAEISAMEADQKAYQFWADGFRQIRLDLIDRVLEELEMSTNEQAEHLGLEGWRIGFATEKENKAGAVSRGFTVTLYPPGVDRPIKWKSYSGGERQRWQLAARFALSEMLLAHAGLSPNLEILDEPTEGLSPQGIEDLLACLSARAKRLNRQVWIVDNRVFDHDAFDGIYSVTKDDDGSTLKRIA